MAHAAFIALGSNIGGRRTHCEKAIALLKETDGISIVATSPWYRSAALTVNDQPQSDYCNGVASLTTELTPLELLTLFKEIEKMMGRSGEREKWQPRIIDIDLLLYDELLLTNADLCIPHPEMEKRLFVLQPLCDIAPRVLHSRLGKRAHELFTHYRDQHPDETIRLWKEAGEEEGL